MKVTVKKYLNVRVGKPSVNAPCYQYLAPGSELEVDGKLYKGDLYDGLDVWLKDLAGNYYWSGGIEEPNVSTEGPQEFPLFLPDKMSWGHKFFNIPSIWQGLNTLGQGSLVAVVDSGVDVGHHDLSSNVSGLSRCFVAGSTLQDIDGHGTHMAGIIAANGTKVYGVAPKAGILIAKASDYVRGADVTVFAQALEYVASIDEVDIVSISNVFIDNAALNSAITKCLSANKLVLASIGNGRDFIGKPNGPDDDTYPACYKSVLAVGAFDSGGVLCSFSNWNPSLHFIAPGDFSVLTTGLNDTTTYGAGTSIATAFATGCLAVLVSYAKQRGISPSECARVLLETCDDVGPSVGRDIQTGFGRLNFRNAALKLKSL